MEEAHNSSVPAGALNSRLERTFHRSGPQGLSGTVAAPGTRSNFIAQACRISATSHRWSRPTRSNGRGAGFIASFQSRREEWIHSPRWRSTRSEADQSADRGRPHSQGVVGKRILPITVQHQKPRARSTTTWRAQILEGRAVRWMEGQQQATVLTRAIKLAFDWRSVPNAPGGATAGREAIAWIRLWILGGRQERPAGGRWQRARSCNRMQLAYLERSKREYELDPARVAGGAGSGGAGELQRNSAAVTVSVPEALYDPWISPDITSASQER